MAAGNSGCRRGVRYVATESDCKRFPTNALDVDRAFISIAIAQTAPPKPGGWIAMRIGASATMLSLSIVASGQRALACLQAVLRSAACACTKSRSCKASSRERCRLAERMC